MSETNAVVMSDRTSHAGHEPEPHARADAMAAMARRRFTVAAGLVLLALALALPAHAAAAALVGPETARLPEVTLGVWIAKAMLVVHAAVVLVAPRLSAAWASTAPATPLLSLARPADEPSTRRSAGRRNEWLLVGGLLILGSVLRLYQLGTGLWFDEIVTLVDYVRPPLTHVVSVFDSQNQHMLYSLLASATTSAFGESAWALRLPAAVLGIASLGAVYWFGTLVTSRREALLALVLLTTSYHHVWFSQNARGYTGLLLFTILGTGLFVELLARRGGTAWSLTVAYAATMALAMYTHATAVLIVAAHFLVWITLIWNARHRRAAAPWWPLAGFVLAATLTLQLYALVLPQFVRAMAAPTAEGVTTNWSNPAWFGLETLRVLTRGLPGGPIAIVVAAVVGAAGIVSYWRQSRAVLSLMLLPAALTAAAMFATRHNLWPRFFFFSAGFAVLIAIRGVFTLATIAVRTPSRRARPHLAPRLATAALALTAGASTFLLPRAWRAKQDYVAARSFIQRMQGSEDAVVTVDLMSNLPYQQYLRAGWLSVNSVAQLEEIEDTHRRTWVVYTFPTRLSAELPGVWSRLLHMYTTAATFPGTVGGGDIVVMVRG